MISGVAVHFIPFSAVQCNAVKCSGSAHQQISQGQRSSMNLHLALPVSRARAMSRCSCTMSEARCTKLRACRTAQHSKCVIDRKTVQVRIRFSLQCSPHRTPTRTAHLECPSQSVPALMAPPTHAHTRSVQPAGSAQFRHSDSVPPTVTTR